VTLAVLTPHLYYRVLALAVYPSVPFMLRSITDSIAGLFFDNLFFRPWVTPVLLPLLLLVGLSRRARAYRRPAWAATLAGAGFFLIYGYDQPIPSMPRLQVALSLMLSIPAALGGALLLAPLRARLLERGARRWGALALLGLSLASFSVAVPFHWRRASYDAELDFLARELPRLATLTPTGGTFVRLGPTDRPRDWVSRDYPDYLLPGGPWQVLDLAPFAAESATGRSSLWQRPVIYFRGFRCYAQLVDAGKPVQPWPVEPGQPAHPACRAFEQTFPRERLGGALSWDGAATDGMLYYPPSRRQEIALFRLLPPAPRAAQPEELILPAGLEPRLARWLAAARERSGGRLVPHGARVNRDHIQACFGPGNEPSWWCVELHHPVRAQAGDLPAGPDFVLRPLPGVHPPFPEAAETLARALAGLADGGGWWQTPPGE